METKPVLARDMAAILPNHHMGENDSRKFSWYYSTVALHSGTILPRREKWLVDWLINLLEALFSLHYRAIFRPIFADFASLFKRPFELRGIALIFV